MSSITIQQKGITSILADAIVNATNTGLWAGGGVCGVIFNKAGNLFLQKELQGKSLVYPPKIVPLERRVFLL